MSNRRYVIRANCPQCHSRDISFPSPEKLREKFVCDEKQIEVLCPFCGAKHKGTLYEEKK